MNWDREINQRRYYQTDFRRPSPYDPAPRPPPGPPPMPPPITLVGLRHRDNGNAPAWLCQQ
eukprot:3542023-Prymnesium_polylepis.1